MAEGGRGGEHPAGAGAAHDKSPPATADREVPALFVRRRRRHLATHYAPLVALVQAGLAGPVLASTVGAVAGAIVNYLLNRSYTFASSRRHRESAPRFMAIAAAGTAMNAALLAALVEGAGIHYLAAQVVATLAVLGFTYVANRAWTF
jgi:putative flippase GtrA